MHISTFSRYTHMHVVTGVRVLSIGPTEGLSLWWWSDRSFPENKQCNLIVQ